MSIKKKNNGKYEVRVQIERDNITGKRYYKYATADTMASARLIEAQTMIDIENGEIVYQPKNETKKLKHYTFEDAFKEWWEFYIDQDLTKSTIDNTARYFRNHLLQPELFGGLYLEEINRLDIQNKVNEFIPKYVKSKKILGYANQVFKYAVDSEHIKIDSNPLEHIRMVKPKRPTKREVKYYDENQALLFEQAFNKYWEHRADYPALFTILLRIGARIGEVLGLQWNDIDFKNNMIRFDGRISVIGNGHTEYLEGLKNHDDYRDVDIDDITLMKLKRWKHEQSEKSLLDGKPINTDSFLFQMHYVTVHKRYYDLLTWQNKNYDVRLPHLNIHGLRHTHATILLSNGEDLKTIGDRLGHRDIAVTANIYADVTPRKKREVADKFSNILESL